MIKGLLVSAPLCHGVKEILPDLCRNHNASIVTNSPRGFVQATLKEGELLGFWNKILTLEDFKSKYDACSFILGQVESSQWKAFLIGDTVSDVHLSKRLGCRSIIVFNQCSWSWPNKDSILEARPYRLIEDIRRLPDIFKEEL